MTTEVIVMKTQTNPPEVEEKPDFKFQVISDKDITGLYSAGCSGGRSDCCSRVCTRYAEPANSEQWEKFLSINAGIIQY